MCCLHASTSELTSTGVSAERRHAKGSLINSTHLSPHKAAYYGRSCSSSASESATSLDSAARSWSDWIRRQNYWSPGSFSQDSGVISCPALLCSPLSAAKNFLSLAMKLSRNKPEETNVLGLVYFIAVSRIEKSLDRCNLRLSSTQRKKRTISRFVLVPSVSRFDWFASAFFCALICDLRFGRQFTLLSWESGHFLVWSSCALKSRKDTNCFLLTL